MTELSDRLANLSETQRALLNLRLEAKRLRPERFAIIGMACRFPGGADSLDAYWRLLRDGVDAVTEVPSSRWDADAYYDPDPGVSGKMNTRWGGFLRDADLFDAGFFGISPREVVQMDPQQRLLLEVTWEALEDAGVRPDRLAGSPTGVFVGIFMDDYKRIQMSDLSNMDSYAGTGSSFSIAANRISYQLDLRGPSLAVDTACSSSLVAVHLACQSLQNGETSLAIAGGVNLILLPDSTMQLTKSGLMSPDGRCKAFDASANGYVRSEGAGVVVLKLLSKALADGDPIHAVIQTTAVNQDGRTNGLTSPNRFAQEAVLREAYRSAGVSPSQVQYVEAHGTGTAVGDAIECRALGAVFGPGRPASQPLTIGSVKTNIGHLETGAGVASLIKVALAMRHGQIPASLHLKTPNPEIPFEELGLKVQTSLGPWPRIAGQPLLAGISSFGFGGTNSHLVLEGPPEGATLGGAAVERPLHVLTLSTRSEPALVALTQRYRERLAAGDGEPLADLCFSANTGRTSFKYRLAAVGATREDLARQLAEVESPDGPLFQGVQRGRERPRVAFLFTGQGSQYAGMGRRLFETQPTFQRALLRCQEALDGHLDRPLLSVLFPEPGQEAPLDDTAYTQPALFALEYALAELWQSWGIVPDALMGHSVGEYVAACVAGVFTLEEGAALIARRARLMADLPRNGAMMAVFASEPEVAKAIGPMADQVSIAAVNGPLNTVISGHRQAVETVAQELGRRGIRVEALQVSHAFHSPLMEPMLGELEAQARKIRYAPPQRPLVSNLTGELLTAGQMDAGYWRRHARRPVRFMAGVEALRRAGCTVFLEIGPGTTLLGMAAKLEGEDSGSLFLPSLKKKQDDWDRILSSLATLFVHGCEVDWQGFDRDYPRTRRRLPTYPFQRERYWCDVRPSRTGLPVPSGQLLERRIDSPALDGVLYESAFDSRHPAFLADHQVFGSVVVPAAALLVMALEAARAAGEGSLEVSDAVFGRALALPEESEQEMQLVLTRDGSRGERFAIYGRARTEGQEGGWTLHASGEVGPAETSAGGEPPSFDAIRSRCRKEVDGPAFYEALARRKIELGPSFRRIERAWVGEGEALGRLLPVAEGGPVPGFLLHPGVLDSAFHVLSPTLPEAVKDVSYLPVGIERLRFYGASQPPRWSHSRLRPGGGAEAAGFTGDLWLYGEDGELVAEVIGIELQRAEKELLQQRSAEPLASWVYEVEWAPAPLSEPAAPAVPRNGGHPGVWLIVTGAEGESRWLSEPLAARGETCIEVVVSEEEPAGGSWRLDPRDPEPFFGRVQRELAGPGIPCCGAVHLVGLSASPTAEVPGGRVEAQRRISGSALQLIQALSRLDRTGWHRLCFATRGAQAVAPGTAALSLDASPLWGLGAVTGFEHPELRPLMVDLDPAAPGDGASELVAELFAPPDEDRLAWREGKRLAPRFIPSASPALRGPLSLAAPLRADGTYLVTGGLGALGLAVVRWMVRRGARHLVLVGRNAERGAEAVEELRQSGAQIVAAAADVAQRQDVEALLEKIRASMPPLRGVFHAAGVLDEGLLINQTWNRFAGVLAPKVQGAWNLHALTRPDPLDHFVLFSSVVPWLPYGGMGTYSAANVFLDALAHQRRGEGLPALSINWGPWADVGMAAGKQDISGGLWEEEGIGMIPVQQGTELLERLLGSDLPQAAVVPIDWPHLLQKLPDPRERPMLSRELERRRQLGRRGRAAKPAEAKVDLTGLVQAAAPEERKGIVTRYLRDQVIQILRLPNGQELDLQLPLQSYGLDSLMAMTIRNRLKSATGQDLPPTLLFDHQTLEDLSGYLHALLLDSGRPSQEA
jgi:acyl transferase domain-containing protein/acyl carrier protein